jgi:hypothetical protein
VAWTTTLGFIFIVYANASELTYFAVKVSLIPLFSILTIELIIQVFIQSIMTIFFSSVEVLGKQNIPEHGPIIFTGTVNKSDLIFSLLPHSPFWNCQEIT